MKKNCNIIKDLLPLYLDEVCSDETKELILKHLKECTECNSYLEGLKFNIKQNRENEMNIFRNFAKRINFKIIRNAIIIVVIICFLLLICMKFYGNYEMISDYNEDMKILLLGDEKKWNFQFDARISGYNYSVVRTFMEDDTLVNYIFITHKYTLQDYVWAKKGVIAGSPLNINYDEININDKMLVYYTTEDLDKIKNVSRNELNNIIDNSTLIFSNEQVSSKINCSLYNENYEYYLTYYKVNEQIISSRGDSALPSELLMDIYSVKGNYKSLWVASDSKSEIVKKLEDYMHTKDGVCNIEIVE